MSQQLAVDSVLKYLKRKVCYHSMSLYYITTLPPCSPKHCGLQHPVCFPYQVLLRSIQRHKSVTVGQLPSSTKVSQFEGVAPVRTDTPHDVARLDVTMDDVVFSQVGHALSCECIESSRE